MDRLTLPNTNEFKIGQVIQAAVIGVSGSGKTFGAGSFPRPNFIDFDRGIATLRHPDFVARYGVRSVEYEQFSERGMNAAGVAKTHNAFDDASRYFDKWQTPANRDKFDTWVIDTGTTLSVAAMNKAMILLGSPTFNKLSKTHDQALSSGLLFPKIQDYGAERSMIEQFIRMVKDTGKHVLLLCHTREVKDKAGDIIRVEMALTGQSSSVVSAMFDNVWLLKVVGAGPTQKRVLTTRTNGVNMVKSRLGVPDGTDFDYDAIQKALDVVRVQQTPLTPGGTSPSAVPQATTTPAIK